MKLKLPFSKSNVRAKPLPYCMVYLSQADESIVAPAHHNFAGVGYEQEHHSVLISPSDPAALGYSVREAFKQYSVLDRNLRYDKRYEWPAYRLSARKSKAQFERDFLRICLCKVTQDGMFVDATTNPPGAPDLTLKVSIKLFEEPEEIGRKLQILGRIAHNLYDRMEDLLD